MTNPKTINITPDPTYIKKAFEHFGIELGGALQMTPDGNFRIDTDAPDYAEVMGVLTGQILADYALGTMVVPSNVQALRTVHDGLAGANRRWGIRLDETGLREALEEATESLASVTANLDGLLGPVER